MSNNLYDIHMSDNLDEETKRIQSEVDSITKAQSDDSKDKPKHQKDTKDYLKNTNTEYDVHDEDDVDDSDW